ncbi:hypothetical protein J2T56_002586 [Natronobacillus azotifigens]|uniref:DUF4350 domain-containing protein n=1 Tax=Natronobacillus azotifigens TaxID=472978 RepID=A0A9J6RC73_9BACI|nr:DUF4350 domain-containing protein [Natronobacillus azotifigens]MCZ0702809.1 DUF4350 domain-containing protein [Natronobacillus azotifigens]
MKQKNTWLALLAALILFILASYFLIREEPEQYPPYVVESPAPMGTKGFYEWLDQTDVSVGKWSAHPSQLTDEYQNELLVMIEPPIISEQAEVDAYFDYIAAGNTVFIAKRNPTDLLQIETEHLGGIFENPNVIRGNENFEVISHSPVRLQPEQGAVLFEDNYGVVAWEQDYGEGKLIVVIEPDWFTNQLILEHDHLAAIFSLVDLGTYQRIYFDTYSHQSQLNRSIFTIYPDYLLVFSFGLLFITVLFLWMKGKRFGPVIQPRIETVRFSDERLTALANWYLRGRNYQEALNIQTEFLKQVIHEKSGAPMRVSWEERLPTLQRLLSNRSEKSVRDFVDGLEKVLHSDKVSKQAFVAWSKQIEQIRKEVEKG